MKLRRSVHLLEGQINVAPLVDIVFLLLIFFMLTSSFVFQPGIRVDPPRGAGGGDVNIRYVVSVSSETPPMLFFNDQISSMDKLAGQFAEIAAREPGATVVLNADRAVSHGFAVEILNLALKEGLSVVVATEKYKEPRASGP